jgi:hypothetical protein
LFFGRLSGRRLGCGGLGRGLERGEEILYFTVDGKPAGLGLGENQLAVDDHVELAGFAGLDFGIFAEARMERRGQTGRARLVASSGAVENFGRHLGALRFSLTLYH